MLRLAGVCAFFISWSVLCWMRADSLPLSFFVFALALAFPVYYFYENGYRVLFWITFTAALFQWGYFFSTHLGWESFLGFCQTPALVGAMILYRGMGVQSRRHLSTKVQSVASELGLLKTRYRERMDSLRHLEKQVASLLDLFEITREFNECLSFQGMAEILQKQVLPKLLFKRLRLLRKQKNPLGEWQQEALVVEPGGVNLSVPDLGEEGLHFLTQSESLKSMEKISGGWLFPLVHDSEIHACAVVEEAQEEDLAKFEVLMAYLALQVKKVKLYETVKELSIRDGLTGFFVRRHFLERFVGEIKRSLKYQLPLAVLLLDIDHFKRYNDEHGHLAGDRALKQVAELLKENLRKVDLVARYGGEEFVVVIPESVREGALEVAERIRSHIAKHPIKLHADTTQVTVSIGTTLFDLEDRRRNTSGDPAYLAVDLIQEADQALYKAKEEGRNRVILFEEL